MSIEQQVEMRKEEARLRRQLREAEWRVQREATQALLQQEAKAERRMEAINNNLQALATSLPPLLEELNRNLQKLVTRVTPSHLL